MTRTLALLSITLLVASTAAAQDPPPQQQDPHAQQLPSGHPPVPSQAPPSPAAEGAAEGLPPGHPPLGQPAPQAEGQGEQLPPGHPPMPQGGQRGDVAQVLSPAQLASAEPSAEVPAGTIRVTVVDPEGRPVADAAVDVGTLAQGGDRARHNARTDASGVASFADLATGSGQAYRVNVPHAGATYSSNPFQLPNDQGYDVRITRLPVTREDRFVFFHVFRVIFELRDDRLHVIHQAELTNAGRETYVFPAAGVRGSLPEGALSFQFQRVMSDQRVEQDGDAYVMRGSLPPGTVQLAWAYDLPVDDETMRIGVDVPMRFFGLQVFSEAPEGLVMDVRGMPDPRRVDNDGQPIWIAQATQGPEEAAIDHVTVTLSGIPGPGPVRWIAVVLAVFFVIGGVVLLVRRGDETEAGARSRARRREEILASIRDLELEYENGEIGPEFRQSRRAELVRALAALLHEEEAAKEKASRAPAAKPPGRPARTAR